MLRSQCKRLSVNCSSTYLKNVDANCKSNPKLFWKFIRDQKSSYSLPSKMFYNNEMLDSGQSIATAFGSYFATVYSPNAGSNLQIIENYNKNESVYGNILCESISKQSIFQAIMGLTNGLTVGPDGIPEILLKKCVCTLTIPLFLLFNLSLNGSEYPEFWKQSYLVPIYKNGDRQNIQNYRSVCTQSAIPKLFDKLICEQLTWACRGLIDESQHGFTKGRSTVTNLVLYQSSLLNALENREQVDAVYTDFSKAFDSVDHSLLLMKLLSIGFNIRMVRWVGSFLSNRVQRVKIGSYQSDIIAATSGVPQGGHCSPLFFNLFINDIKYCFQYSKPLLFADDLKFYRTISGAEDQRLLQSDLNRLVSWCENNKLKLNVAKCFHISFFRIQNRFNFAYYIKDDQIKYASRVKDLGISFDEELRFTDHISNVVVQSSKLLGFVLRNCRNFSVESLKCIYTSIVRSKIEYASIVWSPYHNIHKLSLERVQNKFLRHCAFRLGMRIPDHNYDNMRMITKLDPLEFRRLRIGLGFIFDLVNSLIDCSQLLELIKLNVPTRQLRQHELFQINYHRTDYGRNSPLTRYLVIINQSNLEVFGLGRTEFVRLCKTRLG